LNLSYFISKRISSKAPKSFTNTIHRIAIASIAISLAAMILSFAILFGFQGTIKDKIYSFGSHLLVTKFIFGGIFEEHPISTNTNLYQDPGQFEFIDHIQTFIYKPGLIKNNDEVTGAILKGVGKDFSQEKFAANIVEGEFIHHQDSGYSTEVLLSKITAQKINLRVGDEMVMYFFQNPLRVRKLQIVGLYETWIEDFDKKIVIADIGMIQRLNNWADTLVGGYEIFIDDYSKVEMAENVLYEQIDADLFVEKISDKYFEVFQWLSLIQTNLEYFLVLVLIVACFNMISIVLILIMERTQMIGILKALGSPNKLISKIFIYSGMTLISKGLLWGNLIGIGLCYLQYQFHIIPLDPENYYMEFVPISWDWDLILALNVLVFIVVSLVMAVPIMITSRIQPIKSIRFD